jgi:multiple sugar transport system substrate-binding protein
MLRKSLAVLCAASVVVLAGCGGGASKPAEDKAQGAAPAGKKVTITYWHTYNTDSNENKTLTEVVIPAFEKKYPDIKVESVVQPVDGLHDSLVTATAGGTTPDLMRMDIIWTPEFAKMGGLEAVDGMEGFAQLKDQVFPGPMATNTYKGKYYGLPLDTNTQIFVYNPDYLKDAGMSAPPKTFEEFKKYTQAIAAKGKKSFAPQSNNPWATLPLFWSLGGKVTNDDFTKSTGFLNSDDSVAALQSILDLQKAGAFAGTHLGEQPGTWEGFKSGDYGAIQDGPWFFAIMGNELKDKMVGAPVPAGKGGSISVVGGENIVMFKASKNKDAAWKFMQFMLSDEAQTAMAKTGQMPVTKSASNSPVMKETSYYANYVTQLQTAKPRTPVANWSKIEKVLNDSFEMVLRGENTPKAALDNAAKEIDTLLAD